MLALRHPAVFLSTAGKLREQQYVELVERGKGWPWNGYELRLRKKTGKYPPQRLPDR
jgi:hypothetical protein